jgi:trans-2,3-dihydro-3-hydroxyanthranilate isomerase
MRFHIADVFAQTKYSGNQLAVFLCPSPLPAGKMQEITREINFSESV